MAPTVAYFEIKEGDQGFWGTPEAEVFLFIYNLLYDLNTRYVVHCNSKESQM